ncbi:unnamed protein product, partial [Adineta steineri]
MPQKTLLITDFFSKCHSTTTSNAALFEKPMKVIKVEEESKLFETTSVPKSPIPTRIKFVRHQSAPLHHRSPIKMREHTIEPQDLEEIRARIRAYRIELHKYKSTYSRSPIKRFNTNG